MAQQAPNNNGDLALPPVEEIDWDAMMRDFAPPEWDLLLSATAKNEMDRVRNMIEREQVPVTHSNGIGQTALHVAVLWGHVNLARYLIQAGADVNAANQLAGATPLHTALQSHKINPEQQAALAQLLVDQGHADPTVEDKYGKAPLEYINDQKNTHPLFLQAHYAPLLQKLTPPPPGVDRWRAGFLKGITLDMPTCTKIAK